MDLTARDLERSIHKPIIDAPKFVLDIRYVVPFGCTNLQVMDFAVIEFGCKSLVLEYASIGIWQ